MKTLIYTSIYSNLYGTEYGGRIGRHLHYKNSLLNVLNLKADKFLCFTSKEEKDDLENFFYVENSIDKNVLEFVIFNLENSKFFNKIKKLKKIEEMIKLDRCYEVQYNKFFFLDLIEKKYNYDKIFWIDAGLSHAGIIHSKYQFGEGYEKNFKFNIFNEKLLQKICQISDKNILLISKNNDGVFFWSQTIPEKYYDLYERKEHIIGGLFGGNIQRMVIFKEKFENMLLSLLENEKKLYYEELIMSCLYYNNKNDFILLKFDDWYDRLNPEKYGSNVKYFYNVLET